MSWRELEQTKKQLDFIKYIQEYAFPVRPTFEGKQEARRLISLISMRNMLSATHGRLNMDMVEHWQACVILIVWAWRTRK